MQKQTLVILAAFSLTLLFLAVTSEFEVGDATPPENDGEGCWDTGCHRGVDNGDDLINIKANQKTEDYSSEDDRWTVIVTVEEYDSSNDIFIKTDRKVAGELVWESGLKSAVVVDSIDVSIVGPYLTLTVPVDNRTEGIYTIHAGFNRDGDRVFSNISVELPYPAIPPRATAHLRNLTSDQSVRHLQLPLQDGIAETSLDAFDSWGPMQSRLRYIWHIWHNTTDEVNYTSVNTTDPDQQWTFEQSGTFEIVLELLDEGTGERDFDRVTAEVVESSERADLSVKSLSFLFPDIEQGALQNLSFTIINIGDIPADDFSVSVIDDDGTTVVTRKTFMISSLDPGETGSFEYDWTVNDGDVDVKHTITVIVDPTDDSFPHGAIDEYLEDNNVRSRNFNAIYRQNDVHELTLSGMHIDPGKVPLGTNVSVGFILTNSGDYTEYNVRILITANDVLKMTYVYNRFGAGAITEEMFTWQTDMRGTIKIVIRAYSDEAPKTTDSGKVTVTVGPDGDDDEDDDGFIERNRVPIMATTTCALVLFAFIGSASQTEFGKFSLLSAALPLYTRIKRADTLKNEVRENIYNYIVSNPGDNYLSIMKHLGVKNGTLVYHLATLEREAFIKSRKDGKYKRFYPRGAKISESGRILSEFQKTILMKLAENPGVSQSQLAEMLGKSRQSVNYQMKVLEKMGLIKVVRHGISSRCFPIET